jgi:hypothetical protein
MSAVDRSQLLNVRSDLAGICEYACIRRRTNRAASALILRFFLGYLSTEVMTLLRAKRSNVDTLIETARVEAKAYLNRPGVLRFLSRSERKSISFPRYLPEEPDALFAELQRRIFSETEGIQHVRLVVYYGPLYFHPSMRFERNKLSSDHHLSLQTMTSQQERRSCRALKTHDLFEIEDACVHRPT